MASATTAHAAGIAANRPAGGGRRRRRTPERRPYWQFAAAASASHVCAHTLTSPLKVVQMSSQVGLPHEALAAARGQALSPFRTSAQWMLSQGWRGMWKGNGVACLRALPFNKAQALLYANSVLLLANPDTGKFDPARAFVAGVGSAGLAALLVNPLDVAQTRLTVQHAAKDRRVYRGLLHCLTSIARTEGVRGLYRGTLPSMLSFLPFTAASFACQEVVGYTQQLVARDSLTPMLHLCLAFTTGAATLAVSQFAAYPFDTVKRMLQAQGVVPPQGAGTGVLTVGPDVSFRGMRDCFAAVRRTHGWTGLWRGGTACMVRAVPFALVMSATFAGCQAVFKHLEPSAAALGGDDSGAGDVTRPSTRRAR